jgi:uncharacterized protein (DUF58 family)
VVIDPNFLNQLSNLELVARKRVSNVTAGGKKSLLTGKGIEVSDHREYYPGDDFKAIDWRLYSRTERLYIRRFEEERDLIIHILVDSSSSMDFAMSGMRKFDYAANIAAGFAFVSVNRYEKFGAALFSDRITDIIQPKKGKTHFFRLTELIDKSKQEGKTNLRRSIEEYTKMIKSRSFVVVISDFIEPIDSLKDAIFRVAKYSKEAILVQVLDPGEITLKWAEDVNFEDMESRELERTYLSPNFKEEYSGKIKNHIYSIQEICKDAGVDFFSIVTRKPLFDSFVQIIEDRKIKAL